MGTLVQQLVAHAIDTGCPDPPNRIGSIVKAWLRGGVSEADIRDAFTGAKRLHLSGRARYGARALRLAGVWNEALAAARKAENRTDEPRRNTGAAPMTSVADVLTKLAGREQIIVPISRKPKPV
jgi:hypothetical protein